MENTQGIKWRQKISISATPLRGISKLQYAGFETDRQFQPPYPLGYADTALWSQYAGSISENYFFSLKKYFVHRKKFL